MANLSVGKKEIRKLLENEKKTAAGLAKKIARKANDDKNAIQIYNKYKNEIKKISQKYEKMKLTDANLAADYAYNEYIKILSKLVDIGSTKFRKEEFYIYWVTGRILEYDPWGVEAAYIQGDIEQIEGRALGGIQIKSEGDYFRVAYDYKTAERELNKYNFPPEEIAFTLKLITEIWKNTNKFTVSQLNNNPSLKLDFMKEYHNISRAKWYIIFYGNSTGGYQAISFPADRLNDFVKYFHMILNPVLEKGKRASQQGLARLKISNNIPAVVDIWKQVLTAGSAIHYAVAENFYSTRNEKYESSEIKQYNANFHDTVGFRTIQNSYFAPITYKGR